MNPGFHSVTPFGPATSGPRLHQEHGEHEDVGRRGWPDVRIGRTGDDLRAAALEALDLAKATGDGAHQRAPVHALASAARMTGDYAEARRRYRESIEIGNALGMVSHAPSEYHNLGYVELHSGDLVAAERMFRLALDGARRSRLAFLLPYCVLDFAVLAIAQDAPERGAVLAAAAKAAFDASGVALDPDDALDYESAIRTLGERLDPERLAELTRRGRELPLDVALSLLGDELSRLISARLPRWRKMGYWSA
jgi:tetratricopeptide (TPR) repeat protein